MTSKKEPPVIVYDGNGKSISYTLKTTMTITIRSKMRFPIVVEGDEERPRGNTREFQRKLHQGIAYAIMSAVENERDDDWFDNTAIEHSEAYVEGMDEDDLTDLAEIMIDYQHGDEVWYGERIPTKKERGIVPKMEYLG